MLAPLSWLKDYVTITLPPKELGERLTEIGLGTEKITKDGSDTIFELEITPNRPDLLSIIGIAREIAALEKRKIKLTPLRYAKQNFAGQTKNPLPLTIRTDPKINPRFTGIIVKDITVKESPAWLKERLAKMGQRSINNIVDITNYVMLELGNPIHAFDYDQIKGHKMMVELTKGAEVFKSVDGISYHLPKNSVVIKDRDRIIDLFCIKGGYNSGTFKETKNLFILVPVGVPALVRRTSVALGLRSEASSIFERGVNRGGTIDALNRCVDLILELAGGEIASELYDMKAEKFDPWKLDLRIERLNKILGIDIPEKKVLEILENLNLGPVILGSNATPESLRKNQDKRDPGQARMTNNVIHCTIPTYRNDLQIEEDLIEEVARLYGYNNFPKTLPVGLVPTEKIPYFKDYRIDENVKTFLQGCGFSESYTYSLISEKDLQTVGRNPEHTIRVDNPVSREFEYLRPTLKPNLLKAMRQNKANASEINIFEIGKVYLGNSIQDVDEHYNLAGISNRKSFYEIKGVLQRLFQDLQIGQDPSKMIEDVEEGVYFEINYSDLLKAVEKKEGHKTFKSLPKYPPIIEDLALLAPEHVQTGELIEIIKKQSALIVSVELLDQYHTTRTFHIIYQDQEKNLTNEDVKKVREKIIKVLEEKFEIRSK